jgi:hypothetical protein
MVCRKLYPYDGRADGIVNFGNSKLIAVELFYEMLQFKYQGGVPTATYWKCKVKTTVLPFDDTDDEMEGEERYWNNMARRMNQMLVAFLELVDYGETLFKCCENPRIICVDGIVLSVENRHIKELNMQKPWQSEGECRVRFSQRVDRNLITFKEADRSIISSFIKEGMLLVFI